MSETKLIVIIPNPMMGHLPSTVELAKLIVAQHQHFSILLAILHIPLFNYSKPIIDAYIESQSLETDPNRITFFTLPPLTSPPDKTSPNFFNNVIDIQKPLVKKAVEDRGIKPTAFIFDMLYVSMMDVASELGVPFYIYFTSGANLLSLLFHAQSLFDDKGIDVIFTEFSDSEDTELDIHEFKNRVPVRVLPWFGADNKESEWLKLILNMPRMFRQSKGILVNTFMELESYVIRALLDKSKSKIPTIYPVGPILSLDNGNSQQRDQDQDLLIMGWLDEQPLSSVVFLCFGSLGGFDVDQVREIANGLDQSGYRFLWSLPRSVPKDNLGSSVQNNDNFNEVLPEGYMDRMAYRGKIIKWAPQVQILAHKSIGGFVTHCGWNSILESLWFGVPMATWPLHSEQQLNAFELVKELGLAVEISIDYRLNFGIVKGNYLVTAKEIENGVKRLMNIDKEIRGKVREIGDLGRKALKVSGSSNQWLVRFIEDVLHNSRVYF